MWKHNTFGDMVEGDGDFVGFIAYSLYKEQKVKWIKAYKDRNGEYPSSDEIDTFFTHYQSSPDCVNKYRDDAERMLNDYFDFCFSEELNSYKQTVKEEAIIETINKPFKTAVMENLTAGIVASVLTAFFSVSIWLYSEMKSSERRAEILKHMPISEEVKKLVE
ncbi:hypothetical protein [Photobacterium ganghwense]|uniref:hypothetical protein n=1 Tax=Photobacterium ganghwense TaxID=320778 RepID=UPI0039EF1DE9